MCYFLSLFKVYVCGVKKVVLSWGECLCVANLGVCVLSVGKAMLSGAFVNLKPHHKGMDITLPAYPANLWDAVGYCRDFVPNAANIEDSENARIYQHLGRQTAIVGGGEAGKYPTTNQKMIHPANAQL